MGILKSINKRCTWLFNIKFDKNTGFYKYKLFGNNVYTRHYRHFMEEKEVQWS